MVDYREAIRLAVYHYLAAYMDEDAEVLLEGILGRNLSQFIQGDIQSRFELEGGTARRIITTAKSILKDSLKHELGIDSLDIEKLVDNVSRMINNETLSPKPS